MGFIIIRTPHSWLLIAQFQALCAHSLALNSRHWARHEGGDYHDDEDDDGDDDHDDGDGNDDHEYYDDDVGKGSRGGSQQPQRPSSPWPRS